MTLYRSNLIQVPYNKAYREKVVIREGRNLAAVVMYDHVMSAFVNDERSKINFIHSDCIFADIDNDDDNEDFWVDKADIEQALHDVEYWLVPSKSHLKEKNGRKARPKWHLYFPVPETASLKEYEGWVQRIMNYYDVLRLDTACSDASRHVSGVGTVVQVEHHEGRCVLDVIEEGGDEFAKVAEELEREKRVERVEKTNTTGYSGAGEGGRNVSLFRYLCKLQSGGYTNAEMTRMADEANSKNNPPLDRAEVRSILGNIWRTYPKGVRRPLPAPSAAPEAVKETFDGNYLFAEGDKIKVYLNSPGSGEWLSPVRWREAKVRDGASMEDCLAWLDSTTLFAGVDVNFTIAGPFRKNGFMYYNTFKGFRQFGAPGDCSLFLEHMREHVAGGDEALYKYLMSWMANILQSPNEKPGVALAIQGAPGTGKTSIAVVLSNLLEGYVSTVGAIEDLTSRFRRQYLEGKLLAVCDEGAAGKADYEKLKSLITDAAITTEEKNSPVRTTHNSTRLLITRNLDKPFPVNMGSDDRRWALVTLKDDWGTLEERREWLIRMFKQLENGGYAALWNVLKTWRCVEIRNIPETEAKREEIINQYNDLEAYYEACTSEDGLVDPDRNVFAGDCSTIYLSDMWKEVEAFSGRRVELWQKRRWSREFLTNHPNFSKAPNTWHKSPQ